MKPEEIAAAIEENTMELEHAKAKVKVLSDRRRKLFQQGAKAGCTWAAMGRAAKITAEAVYRDATGTRSKR